ncbi:MAG: hypothetical protein AAF228_13760 [Pseudomonadota bacterium]
MSNNQTVKKFRIPKTKNSARCVRVYYTAHLGKGDAALSRFIPLAIGRSVGIEPLTHQ